MQKLFFINTGKNSTLISNDVNEINNFIGDDGKIISLNTNHVQGHNNTIDWFIVAENNEKLKPEL